MFAQVMVSFFFFLWACLSRRVIHDRSTYLFLLVLAAASIANIVKSSLGPVGLDKMLVDEIGVSISPFQQETLPTFFSHHHPFFFFFFSSRM